MPQIDASSSDASVWRVSGMDGVELFRASYSRHHFTRHTHETLAFGVVEDGVGEFWCGGATHVAPPDTLVLIGAGQAHTGGTARFCPAPLRYRMVYVHSATIARLIGHSIPEGAFTDHGPYHTGLARHIRRVHRSFELPAPPLEHEHRLQTMLQHLLDRFGRTALPAPRQGREPAAVGLIKDYLNAHFSDPVSARDLSRVVRLHPAYLNRVFRAQTGMPPHAYLTDLRVRRARKLLASGHRCSEVAYATGFADQSHLTRCFKRAVGVTPGEYQKQLGASR